MHGPAVNCSAKSRHPLKGRLLTEVGYVISEHNIPYNDIRVGEKFRVKLKEGSFLKDENGKTKAS